MQIILKAVQNLKIILVIMKKRMKNNIEIYRLKKDLKFKILFLKNILLLKTLL
jgi:hypothetical protein